MLSSFWITDPPSSVTFYLLFLASKSTISLSLGPIILVHLSISCLVLSFRPKRTCSGIRHLTFLSARRLCTSTLALIRNMSPVHCWFDPHPSYQINSCFSSVSISSLTCPFLWYLQGANSWQFTCRVRYAYLYSIFFSPQFEDKHHISIYNWLLYKP